MVEWKFQNDFIPYSEALAWMETRVKAIQNNKSPECIWFLEHPPLYTLGSSAQEKDVLSSCKFPSFKTGRGGKVTYHGPGQRVVYVMLDLNKRQKDLKRYVFDLEEWIIQTLSYIGIQGERREGRIGIWVQKNGQDHKIAAIGVRVQKWVTSHGMAFNVCPDLSHYQHIIPCGIPEFGVTSLKDLGFSLTLKEVDEILQKTCPFVPCD
jgi:lipoyl(octanoyl) transferase